MIRSSFARASVSIALLLSAGGCSGAGSSPAQVVPQATPAPAATASYQFSRPSGTYYALATGPLRPSLDVIGATGAYNTSAATITLRAKLAAPVVLGGPNYYVWGLDRGGATFAPFPGEPKVLFNVVIVETVQANGSYDSVVSTLGTGALSTTLPPTATAIANDTIAVTFPASLVPSTGLSPNAYLWNLWPRSGVGAADAKTQLASFAPENAVLPLVVAP